MRPSLTIACAGLAALAAVTAGAADPTPAELGACRELAQDAERLACYDRVVGRMPAQAAAPAAAVPAPTAEENFGRDRVLAAEEAKRREQESRAAGELNAAVTAIETRVDGLMTITLDNGQVWRQSRPDSMFRLKVGDPVKIQPGSLKSFILSGPSNRSTRVARVQ
jgi:hypothetical protein